MDISDIEVEKAESRYTRSNPAQVRLKERFALTKPGSTKATYHICLDLKNSGLEFKVGDSIGVIPQNDPTLVQHLIEALKSQGQEQIVDTRSNETFSLREFLVYRANLSRLTSSFLKLLNSYGSSDFQKNNLNTLLLPENKALLTEYLSSHDPLDVLKEYLPVEAPLQDLCSQFGPLLPRFYSAASSQKVVADEVHLTVDLFTYTHSGEKRFGVASHFLCNLCQENITPVPVYVQSAKDFTLPQDQNTPIIMIGPGTGIAPFRGFLQERRHFNAKGKNWLFFGERNRAFDFFYEDFFTELVKDDKLQLELAFSRDQPEKVYVQHKLQQNAKALWAWLQEGAYLYVCGDATYMAKDVDAALRMIVMQQGPMNEEEARIYLKKLRAEKRYLLDVY